MEVTGRQVRDASIQLVDLDTATPGQAVITKLIVTGAGVTEAHTGVDAGTGVVTLTIPGGGGGGGSGTAGHCASMSRASATDALGMTTTNTSVYLVDLVPDAGFELSVTSTFEVQIAQTSSGSLRFVLTDASFNVIAYSDIIVNPASGVRTATMTFVSGTTFTLVPGTRYYAGIMSNQNSPFLLGRAATNNTNQTPYIAIKFDNIGSMTVPAQFTGGGESLLRLYIRLKV
jgi:hypothetical protein